MQHSRLLQGSLLLSLLLASLSATAASYNCTDRWGHRYTLAQIPTDNSDSLRCTPAAGSAPAKAKTARPAVAAASGVPAARTAEAAKPTPADAAAALGLKKPLTPVAGPVPNLSATGLAPVTSATPTPVARPVAQPVVKPAPPADVASVFGFGRASASGRAASAP